MSQDEKKPLRVLFLNPPSKGGEIWMKEVGRCGRKAIGGEVWPQTGLAYLAAMAGRSGHEARIIDAMAERLTLGEVEAQCGDWKPDLVLANSATPTIRYDSIVLDRLKQTTGALCGFLGPHGSALPKETLQESSADVVLINEAEDTVVALLDALSASLSFRERDKTPPAASAMKALFEKIDGLAWRVSGEEGSGEKDEFGVNAPRALVQDLDNLPLPARDLLPNHAYRMPFFREHPFATIIPSRGCPWPCSFCRAGGVWGKKIRVRSVQSVLGEIESLRRDFGIGHIVFMTDSLTLNRQWAKELFSGLMDLENPVEWICNSRVDVVDAEMLALMKRAGCQMVSYGLESGSREVLERCRKGITLEQSEAAIRETRRAGLLSMAYFILGLPGETAESVEESIRFAKRLDPDYVNFHVATPFPGTDLYQEAQEKGWLTSENWDDYEQEASAVLQVGERSSAELIAAQSRAMRSFYMRPKRLLRELARVRGWSDLKVKLRAGLRVFSILSGKK